jgi:hypothetical protein
LLSSNSYLVSKALVDSAKAAFQRLADWRALVVWAVPSC